MSFKYDEIKCPECDGPMISRNGKFGTFCGCKKFPECKGTRDSNGDSKYDRAKERNSEHTQYFNDKKEDKEVLQGLMEEINNHDLREG